MGRCIKANRQITVFVEQRYNAMHSCAAKNFAHHGLGGSPNLLYKSQR